MSRRNFLYFWWQVLLPFGLQFLATSECLDEMVEQSNMFQAVHTDQYTPAELMELHPDLILQPDDPHDLYLAIKETLYEGLRTQLVQQLEDERPWL